MQMFGSSLDDASSHTGQPTSTGVRRTLTIDELLAELREAKRPLTSAAHHRVDFVPCGHGGFKYPPASAAEGLAWRRALCGINPFDPCGSAESTANLQPTNETTVLVVLWLLAACGALLGAASHTAEHDA